MLPSEDRRFPNEEDGYPEADAFHGVLWTHTARDITASPLPESVRELSSHYWSGPIEPVVIARAPLPCLDYVGPFRGPGDCTACRALFPRGYFARGSFDGCSGPREPLMVLPELPLERTPQPNIDLGPVFAAENLMFVAAAEPYELRPEEGPSLVGFDFKTHAVAVVLTEGPEGVRGFCPSGGCAAGVDAAGDAVFAFAANAPPRAAGRWVLSAREQALFRVEDGRVTRSDVHAPDVLVASRSFPRGEILAATYNTIDGGLYVLVHRDRDQEVALVRMDGALTDVPEVVGSSPRATDNHGYRLVADVTGGFFVLAENDWGEHLVFALGSRDQGYEPYGMLFGQGPLAAADPIADLRGLSFVVGDQVDQHAVGVRRHELWPASYYELEYLF